MIEYVIDVEELGEKMPKSVADHPNLKFEVLLSPAVYKRFTAEAGEGAKAASFEYRTIAGPTFIIVLCQSHLYKRVGKVDNIPEWKCYHCGDIKTSM